MSGVFTTSNTTNLNHANIYASFIRQQLFEELSEEKWFDTLTEFPHGDTFTFPEIGTLLAMDATENEPAAYQTVDTGLRSFSVDSYKEVAVAMTRKKMRDHFHSSQLLNALPNLMTRAIKTSFITSVLTKGNTVQTADSPNNFGSWAHRLVGSGTSRSGTFDDLRRISSTLRANNSSGRMIGLVDHTFEFALGTQTNGINGLSNVPMHQEWAMKEAQNSGRFIGSVYGIDLHVCPFLPKLAAAESTIQASAGDVVNLFFNVGPTETPFLTFWRAEPYMETAYDIDNDKEKWVMRAEWGSGIQREETLATLITNPAAISGAA